MSSYLHFMIILKGYYSHFIDNATDSENDCVFSILHSEEESKLICEASFADSKTQ